MGFFLRHRKATGLNYQGHTPAMLRYQAKETAKKDAEDKAATEKADSKAANEVGERRSLKCCLPRTLAGRFRVPWS